MIIKIKIYWQIVRGGGHKSQRSGDMIVDKPLRSENPIPDSILWESPEDTQFSQVTMNH